MGGVGGYRDVGLEGDEFAGEIGHVFLNMEFCADRSGDLREMGIQVVEVMVFGDQFFGGDFADAFDAGDVVGVVAEQGHIVDDLGGWDAVFFEDLWGGDQLGIFAVFSASSRVVDVDVFGDELGKVFVTRDDQDMAVIGFAAFGESTDDIVSFDAALVQNLDTEAGGDVADDGELFGQFFGHFFAGGLVCGEELVSEGGGSRIEDDGDLFGRFAVEEAEKDIDIAKDGAGVFASGVEEGVFDKGEVCAVDERRAIDKEESFAGHGDRSIRRFGHGIKGDLASFIDLGRALDGIRCRGR